MELAPAAVVRREGEPRRRLHLAFGRDLHRTRERLAHIGALDRDPGAPRKEDCAARIGGCGQQRECERAERDFHGDELTRIADRRHSRSNRTRLAEPGQLLAASDERERILVHGFNKLARAELHSAYLAKEAPFMKLVDRQLVAVCILDWNATHKSHKPAPPADDSAPEV